MQVLVENGLHPNMRIRRRRGVVGQHVVQLIMVAHALHVVEAAAQREQRHNGSVSIFVLSMGQWLTTPTCDGIADCVRSWTERIPTWKAYPVVPGSAI